MSDINETMQTVDSDDWDDVDLSDLSDEAESDTETDSADENDAEPSESAETAEKADQPAEAVEAQQETTAQEQTQEQPEADQRFELKHLDERREVTLDEMKTLAQKGMDYDRIREERDEMREGWEFLKELAGGKPVQDLMDEARAARLSEQEGIDREIALGRVKLARERKAFEAEQQKAAAAQQAQTRADEAAEAGKAAHERWRQDCFVAFSKEFPGVDPTAIPKEVWDAFNKGETLVSAYRGYKLRELEEEKATKQQAEDAAQRSTGSRQGAGTSEDDEFDRLWYDDD